MRLLSEGNLLTCWQLRKPFPNFFIGRAEFLEDSEEEENAKAAVGMEAAVMVMVAAAEIMYARSMC